MHYRETRRNHTHRLLRHSRATLVSVDWLTSGGGGNQGGKQHTWVKVTDTRIAAARLDRL